MSTNNKYFIGEIRKNNQELSSDTSLNPFCSSIQVKTHSLYKEHVDVFLFLLGNIYYGY